MVEIIYNMSDEEYFALPYLSQSALKKYIYGGAEKEFSLETRTVGHAMEVAVFKGREEFEKIYAPSRYKMYCDGMIKEREELGKITVTQEHYDRMLIIRDIIEKESPETHDLLQIDGDEQVVIIFEKEGIQFKAKLDKVMRTKDACIILDLKTFSKRATINERVLGYICKDFGYDIQDSLYIEAASKAFDLPTDKITFRNAFIGKWEGAPVISTRVSQVNLDAANTKILYGIRKWLEHKENGTLPTVEEIMLDHQSAFTGGERSRSIELTWFDDTIPEEMLL